MSEPSGEEVRRLASALVAADFPTDYDVPVTHDTYWERLAYGILRENEGVRWARICDVCQRQAPNGCRCA